MHGVGFAWIGVEVLSIAQYLGRARFAVLAAFCEAQNVVDGAVRFDGVA